MLIGKKGAMSYVLAAVTQFNSGANEISIKARGRAISRAVDVAEMVRSQFLPDVKVKKITIGTETLALENGEQGKVSAIEIILEK